MLDKGNMLNDKPICDDCALPGLRESMIQDQVRRDSEERIARIDQKNNPQIGEMCARCGVRPVAGLGAKLCVPCSLI